MQSIYCKYLYILQVPKIMKTKNYGKYPKYSYIAFSFNKEKT